MEAIALAGISTGCHHYGPWWTFFIVPAVLTVAWAISKIRRR